MAGFHIAVTAYTAGALASCAELPDGLTKSEAGILSKWLAPGLLLHVALTAFGVFRWCTALKLAPSVDSALVTPASAELLLCVASLAILSVGLRCAEKAARKAPDSSHLLERTTEARKLSHPFGLPAREWLWMGLVGVLVTTFVTSRDEQECECPENERKWAAFGL
ncbi:hypothetical protein DIPPA_15677 [Diplonema papillatum]|nr:hypothetical protein DIPPA_15677 [Diplonema papillatum]